MGPRSASTAETLWSLGATTRAVTLPRPAGPPSSRPRDTSSPPAEASTQPGPLRWPAVRLPRRRRRRRRPRRGGPGCRQPAAGDWATRPAGGKHPAGDGCPLLVGSYHDSVTDRVQAVHAAVAAENAAAWAGGGGGWALVCHRALGGVTPRGGRRRPHPTAVYAAKALKPCRRRWRAFPPWPCRPRWTRPPRARCPWADSSAVCGGGRTRASSASRTPSKP